MEEVIKLLIIDQLMGLYDLLLVIVVVFFNILIDYSLNWLDKLNNLAIFRLKSLNYVHKMLKYIRIANLLTNQALKLLYLTQIFKFIINELLVLPLAKHLRHHHK